MSEPGTNQEAGDFTDRMLVELARDARKAAYPPYSGFTVGAACKAESGITYFGCNVENSSYPVGICAERAAVAGAIAHGEKGIVTLAIAGGGKDSRPDGEIRPCGMCLQFLSEFMAPSGRILIADDVEGWVETTLGELLPHAFNMKTDRVEKEP